MIAARGIMPGHIQIPRPATSASQRTKITRHLAEFLDHLSIAEIPGSGIARAAERDGADVTFLARQYA